MNSITIFKFNVYSLKWSFIEEFWAGTDYGLKKVGDYTKQKSGYTKPVFIKRVE